jgi:hypothetical protein
MFSKSNLDAYRRELSIEFDKKIELYDANRTILQNTFALYRKKSNAFYHLHTYRHTLYMQYYESDFAFNHPEMVALNKKIAKVSNILYKVKREEELLRLELDILEYNTKVYSLGYNKANKKISNFLLLNKKNSKITHLTKTKGKILEEQMCPICLDNHKITDIVTTSCGHTFGKKCFEKMMQMNREKEQNICCPLCRNTNLEFTIYRKK